MRNIKYLTYSMKAVCQIIFFLGIFHPTLQECTEEISYKGNTVIWHETPTAENIHSNPLCFYNDSLITRNCSGSSWTPAIDELAPCLKTIKYFDLTACPPGYNKIAENSSNYCYQIGKPSAWYYPCFASGGASVITDLSSNEEEYLLNSLKAVNISRYFWLPAKRENYFLPLVWKIPGPNWGQRVTPNTHLRLQGTFSKHCLLLDVELNILTTDICSLHYPSLCFLLNDIYYPAQCPDGYYSFRLTPGHGSCYGIVNSDTEEGLTFSEFLDSKCNEPMTADEDINKFIFKNIAELNGLPNDRFCWIKAPDAELSQKGVINNLGMISTMNSSSTSTCMACEAEVIHGQTELMFEYNYEQNLIYLTIYYPSGLWRYDEKDKGIQCFSDAKGFVRVINVNDSPFIEIKPQRNTEISQIEKIVYVIDLVTDSSAQYWCEGHTVNLSLVTTNKLIVNPKAHKIHVFSLVLRYYVLADDINDMNKLTSALITNVTDIFDAKTVLLMDVIDYNPESVMILFHLHVAIENTYADKSMNIQITFNKLKNIAETNFQNYRYMFVNMSSSVFCLPTTSNDTIELDWSLTPIGQISAPEQFCLQSNGLPVKRRCEGSYVLGAIWGKVDGHCDDTYEPSETTTLLYNFLTKPTKTNNSLFLTEGLSFVLDDTDRIIPADIYYLSMSLLQISDMAQQNVTTLDTADIEHITWVMDRVMTLDCDYLRLAQTLNSTNVIVDSISDLIEIIGQKTLDENSELNNVTHHQLAIKPNFIVQITYPYTNNITGIALINNSASDNFIDMIVRPLYKNTTLDDVLSINNLEIATWLSSETLDSLQAYNDSENENNEKQFHIVITIYYNDAVFQELQNNIPVVNSRIIGVAISEYISNLEYPIPIIFKQKNNTDHSFCAYWDFQHQEMHHVPGSWKNKGCYTVSVIGDLAICHCYHLTHFGQLIYTPDENRDDKLVKNHTFALNIITAVGSFLSLLGIGGIWITALIFGNWRKKPGTKVLLQLSTAIALPLLFILIFNLDFSMFITINGKYEIDKDHEIVCIVLGALLHYSLLASFMWMLITAILQFIRYVRVLGVLRPSRFMCKFAFIGWGIPVLPVIITVALNPYNYIPPPSTVRRICYPNGFYFVFAVLIPICVILFVNITLFGLVLYAISRRTDQKMKCTDIDLVGAQLRVSILLVFLLGLTWLFGIFSFSSHLIWSYLFCLTSTMQGFVLFIYFVICDPNTRGLWVTLMRPQLSSSLSRCSISSTNTMDNNN